MIAPEVFTLPDPARLVRAAAEQVVQTLRGAQAERETASLVLTGGSTPRPLYGLLATDYAHAVDWHRVRVFFSDERFVPHDHAASNYRLAKETLLDPLGLPPAHVHPFPTDQPSPEAAARAYERALRAVFDDAPAFDLVLLGMGSDGHVASLFPGGPEVGERDRWAVVAEAPAGAEVRERLSLTLPVLSAGRTVLFLVSGAEKREAVRAVFESEAETPPAERVGARERLLWFLDAAAYDVDAASSAGTSVS